MAIDPVKAAESILEAAFEMQEKRQAETEAAAEKMAESFVQQLGISHEQAKAALHHYDHSLARMATAQGVDPDTMVRHMTESGKWMFMGISVGYIITRDHYRNFHGLDQTECSGTEDDDD